MLTDSKLALKQLCMFFSLQTSGHNWHIHQNPPVDGQSCGDSIGPHFNPFNVNTTGASGYAEECTENFQLRCESGDLSGKHGVLNIDPASNERETVTYTDPNLHLYGPDKYSSEQYSVCVVYIYFVHVAKLSVGFTICCDH